MSDAKYQELLARIDVAQGNCDRFDENDSVFLLSFCDTLDWLEKPWKAIQFKTKFTDDDLRLYVTGDDQVQLIAKTFEGMWFIKYYEGDEDD